MASFVHKLCSYVSCLFRALSLFMYVVRSFVLSLFRSFVVSVYMSLVPLAFLYVCVCFIASLSSVFVM